MFEIKISEDQKPEEIAKANSLDYYVSGSYRMERIGLEVRSRLIDARTKNIQSSADILIERKELNPDDLVLIDNMADEFKSAQKKKSYQEHLEKLHKGADIVIYDEDGKPIEMPKKEDK